jgi:uncharacterized membrane protein
MDRATPTTHDAAETVVGLSFDDRYRAQEFLTAMQRLASQGHLTLKDAVIVIAGDGGRTEVIETTDPKPARTALTAAMWFGLVGLLAAGPVGWLAGGAVGAGAGALAAKAIDLGLPDEWVDWFRSSANPGTVTVALLVTDLDRSALVAEAERFAGARLVHANLDQHTLSNIRAALGQHELPPPAMDPSPSTNGSGS